MASVGQGAALGLESGFRMAMQAHAQQRMDERMDRQDSLAQGDRVYARTRQENADALAAVQSQHAEFGQRRQAVVDSGMEETQAQKDAATAEGEGINARLQAAHVKMGGYDPANVAKVAAVGQDALNTGDVGKLQANPGMLTQTIVAQTGQPPDYFKRGPNGEPSQSDQDIKDVQDGLQSGNHDQMLKGANGLLKTRINQGIGTQGAQGGTIVGKRLIGLIPHTDSQQGPGDATGPTTPPTDNQQPQQAQAPAGAPAPGTAPGTPGAAPGAAATPDVPVTAMLRIYTNNGKAEESGDEMRARRSMDPNAPAGATGHYDAPMTQNRSTNPADPVKSLSAQGLMDQVGQYQHMTELMNTPQAEHLLANDAKSGWDANRYQAMQTSYGVQATPKTVTTNTPVAAGASIYQEVKNARTGAVISHQMIEGQDKQFRDSTTQSDIAAINAQVANGTITKEQGDDLITRRLTTASQPKGRLASSDDEGDGGNGLSKGEERLIKASQATLKQQGDALKDAEGRIERKYEADSKGAGSTKRAAANAERTAGLAAVDTKRTDLDAQIKKLQDRLDVTVAPKAGEPTGLGTPGPAGSTAPLNANNPGALMPGGKLAQYKTPEEGIAALDANLAGYGKQGVNTISAVIGKWAPPNKDKPVAEQNNTTAYIADVAQRLGVKPDQPLDMSNAVVRHALGTAIMLHENGSGAVFGGGAKTTLAAAGKTAPAGKLTKDAAAAKFGF